MTLSRHSAHVGAPSWVLCVAAFLFDSASGYASQYRMRGISSSTPSEKAVAIMAQMTLEEKIALVHGNASDEYIGWVPGNARLNIPEIRMQDGPQGFRTRGDGEEGTTTQWPSGMAGVMSWDSALMYKWAEAMGQEFRGKGANLIFGPAVNMHRVPQGGRNFEYISGEDPYLGYKMVQPLVKGLQDAGLIANMKHFTDNEQEGLRSKGHLVGARHVTSSQVDERTQMELYGFPFLGAVEAGVLSAMCGNHMVNGVHACEDNFTQNTMLKTWFGFKGFILSDYRGTQSTVAAALGGLDMQTPGCAEPSLDDETGYTCVHQSQRPNFYGKPLHDAVLNGTVPQSVLDDKVRRILYALFTAVDAQMGEQGDPKANVTSPHHRTLARNLAKRSMVLLKNDGGLLPLNEQETKTQKILVVGKAAHEEPKTAGGGSGAVVPSYISTVFGALRERLGADADITYHSGDSVEEVSVAAKECDLAIVVIGDDSREGQDRSTLSLPQAELVPAVTASQNRTIVLVAAPGTFLAPWENTVPVIMGMWLSGQEQGAAVVKLLFGDESPSGKLIFTIPHTENDMQIKTESYPGVLLPFENCTVGFHECYAVNYTEGLEMGYRWYHAHDVHPVFPFGHGLTYSTFELSNLRINGSRVSVTVNNTGDVPAREVVQLYLTYPAQAGEPPRQLRDFEVVFLRPGHSMTVSFVLSQRAVSIWDTAVHDWKVAMGTFLVEVGFSSQDLPVSGNMDLSDRCW